MNASQDFAFEANDGSIAVADLASALNIIDQLRGESAQNWKHAEAAHLALAEKQAEVERLMESNRTKVERLFDAKQHLTAHLDGNDIDVEEGSDLEALCNVLDVERTQYVDILVTATWHVTATIPSKYDPQEWADEQEWSAEFDENVADFDVVYHPTFEAEVR